MDIKKENDVLRIIKEDEWMMDILRAAKTLNLPDWWICAGFVRSKIWDTLHGFAERTSLQDVDVIFFDKTNINESTEKALEEKLKKIDSNIPWSVKNQARMHVVNDLPPYSSSVDAISKFPETATALGVKLDKKDNLILTAPCGLVDVINLEIKPTSHFIGNKVLATIYEERLLKKSWKSIWNKLKVRHIWEIGL